MNLAERIRLYIRLFSKRADIHVWEATWKPVSASPELPESASFFAKESLRFVWGFEEGSEGRHPSSDGGVLHLHPGHEQDSGWRDQNTFYLDGVAQSLMFDFLVDEGTSHLVVLPGQSIADAVPAFYNANDDALRRFESLEAYLTLGARRAFVWYWPNEDEGESEDVLARLHEGSLEAGSDGLRDGLISQGASEIEADALLAWLGDDARMLVPSRATAA